MAKVIKLEYPENVTLLTGSMQHWKDAVASAREDWAQILAPEVQGKTLVIGMPPAATLTAIGQRAESLHLLVRSIPDAAALGNAHPDATVWCGDPAALRQEAVGFDTVICIIDASVVLPLESEPRDWQTVQADVSALALPDAAVITWIENDLGVHRITQSHNPRAERYNKDWAVMATWDDTRPRSLPQVRSLFPDARLYLTWPSDRHWKVVANPDSIDDALHATLATHCTAAPMLGPDPTYIIAAAARAGRLHDFASGWLVVQRSRSSTPAPAAWLTVEKVTVPVGPQPKGLSALTAFAELAASEDLSSLRRFIGDWSASFQPDEHDNLTHDPAFSLNVASQGPDGEWRFSPIVARTCNKDSKWEALGALVWLIRVRGWRTPWPATYADARILNHLGIMAGMHTVPVRRTASLIPPIPGTADPFSKLDKQSLAAAVCRNNETIRTLRSQVHDLEGRLKQAQAGQVTDVPEPRIPERPWTRIIGRGSARKGS